MWAWITVCFSALVNDGVIPSVFAEWQKNDAKFWNCTSIHRLYSVGIRKKTCNLKIVGFLEWISGVLVASCFANRRGLTYWNVLDLKQIRVVPYMWEITNRDPWKKRTKMRETIILKSAVCFCRSLRLLKLSGVFVFCWKWTVRSEPHEISKAGWDDLGWNALISTQKCGLWKQRESCEVAADSVYWKGRWINLHC